MKNLTEYNEFKNKKSDTINEAAQLFDNTWKVRVRISVPSSLISSYCKKVQMETNVDVRKTWSEQEIAEEIANYLENFLKIENLPSSILTNANIEPKTTVQEEIPEQTEVQPEPVETAEKPTETPEQPVQAQKTPNAQPEETSAQTIAQKVPQTEKGAQEI